MPLPSMNGRYLLVAALLTCSAAYGADTAWTGAETPQSEGQRAAQEQTNRINSIAVEHMRADALKLRAAGDFAGAAKVEEAIARMQRAAGTAAGNAAIGGSMPPIDSRTPTLLAPVRVDPPPPGSPSSTSNVSGLNQPPPMDSYAAPTPGTTVNPRPDYRNATFETLRNYSNALPAQERQRSLAMSAQARGLIDQREYGAARILAERALDIHPGNAQAHFFAGEAARALGDLAAARLHYGYAARFDPDPVLSALATDRLQNLDKPTGTATGAAAGILGSTNPTPPAVQPANTGSVLTLEGNWNGVWFRDPKGFMLGASPSGQQSLSLQKKGDTYVGRTSMQYGVGAVEGGKLVGDMFQFTIKWDGTGNTAVVKMKVTGKKMEGEWCNSSGFCGSARFER